MTVYEGSKLGDSRKLNNIGCCFGMSSEEEYSDSVVHFLKYMASKSCIYDPNDSIEQRLYKRIFIHEEAARFQIYNADASSMYDPKSGLTSCLQELKEMYHDLRCMGLHWPNEYEFRAYDILLNLTQKQILRSLKVVMEHKDLFKSSRVQDGIKAILAFKTHNCVKEKELKEKFYVCRCILHKYAFDRIHDSTYSKSHVSRIPTSVLVKDFCETYSVDAFELGVESDKICITYKGRQFSHSEANSRSNIDWFSFYAYEFLNECPQEFKQIFSSLKCKSITGTSYADERFFRFLAILKLPHKSSYVTGKVYDSSEELVDSEDSESGDSTGHQNSSKKSVHSEDAESGDSSSYQDSSKKSVHGEDAESGDSSSHQDYLAGSNDGEDSESDDSSGHQSAKRKHDSRLESPKEKKNDVTHGEVFTCDDMPLKEENFISNIFDLPDIFSCQRKILFASMEVALAKQKEPSDAISGNVLRNFPVIFSCQRKNLFTSLEVAVPERKEQSDAISGNVLRNEQCREFENGCLTEEKDALHHEVPIFDGSFSKFSSPASQNFDDDLNDVTDWYYALTGKPSPVKPVFVIADAVSLLECFKQKIKTFEDLAKQLSSRHV